MKIDPDLVQDVLNGNTKIPVGDQLFFLAMFIAELQVEILKMEEIPSEVARMLKLESEIENKHTS